MRLKPNNLYCGDCIELLSEAQDLQAHLIFADPPFNIGYQYDRYDDNKEYDVYVSWTEQWMQACKNVLADNGSFYIAIGDEYAAEIRMIARKLELNMRNWIIWHYTFGQQTTKKFARAHTHIFYFTNHPKNFTFNDKDIRIPSARQLIYNDKRANSDGKIPDDVWRYSRVCGTFKERVRWHNCQMPMALLARIIKTSSNSGDIVLDPFNGSGTTTLTAAILGRKYIGIDISENYINLARQRIEQALAENIKDIDCCEAVYVPYKSRKSESCNLFDSELYLQSRTKTQSVSNT